MFSTGAFAPGVTVDKATYKMWAIDGGIKYNRLAVNGQYFMRWLNDFEADGPLPLSSTFDHGYELSASYFVIPKKLLVYGRSSQVFGQFGNAYEYGDQCNESAFYPLSNSVTSRTSESCPCQP